jgi:hypothetical protein
MESNPAEMITRTVKGMLPKNDMRPAFLAKMTVYPEGSPDLEKLKLPQFSPIKPIDYNKIFGYDKPFTPENYQISNIRGDPSQCNFSINFSPTI